MIHAYHVIFGAYGFWLPNDPRGSWSDVVGRWELVRFGRATKCLERRNLNELSPEELRQRDEARLALKFPAVRFTGAQARAIGNGFAMAARKSNVEIWACSILPDHVHLVIARHRLTAEQIVNLLKGEGTKRLRKEGLDPFASAGGQPHSPWADRKFI